MGLDCEKVRGAGEGFVGMSDILMDIECKSRVSKGFLV